VFALLFGCAALFHDYDDDGFVDLLVANCADPNLLATCEGVFRLDFSEWMAANTQKAPGPGTTVHLQAWFRAPPSPRKTSLSNALLPVRP
jgi:hypothetical protein